MNAPAASSTVCLGHMPPDDSVEAIASHAQEALWFIERLRGPNETYLEPHAVRLTGQLNVDALERSFAALIARHPSLRTGFAERDGRPVALVHRAAGARLEVVAAAGETVVERERSMRALFDEAATRPFDLARPPLIRGRLIRLAPDEHVLVLVIHHIVSDGWSMGIVVREIGAMYAAFAAGRAPSLPGPGTDFVQFARTQRERFATEEGARDLQYWLERLADLQPLELPSDPDGADHGGTDGATEHASILNALTDGLRALAQRERSTLFMVMLAAFETLVMRLSWQDDVAVGVPFAGRNRSELEGVVGYFVNPLVLRTDLSGSPRFTELLARTRETTLDALAHQETPFEQLVAALAPERDLDRNPLFDVMFNYVDGLVDAFDLPGLDCRAEEPPRTAAKFSMTLYAEARPDEIRLRLVYRRNRFSQARAAAMMQQYLALLEQIVDRPDSPILVYSLVTDAARRSLPDPTAPIPVPPQVAVPGRFLELARMAPQAIAIRHADLGITYDELASRSATLAAALRERGVGCGDVVAIEMPRGPALVESMLATLMSGAAFAIVDPALPAERRLLMLRESGAKLALLPAAAGDGTAAAEACPGIAVMRLPANGDPLRGAPAVEAAEVNGDDPAYVFFTSGSTGAPKAVLGRHKSLSHFLGWQRSRFEVGVDDRVSQLIGLSFDPLLRDVFLPLTTGATLCIPGGDDLVDPIAWLRRERVTIVHSTPAVLQSWLAGRSREALLPDLRWLFVSGEPLTDSLVARWRSGPGRTGRMANFYGPTETTMIRCMYEVPARPGPGIQPIGLPLPETQALVLNAAGALCGVGEPGEIVLRTPFSTLGYLNLPDENRRRFRRNPFRDEESDVVYFTGDRGRYRPDGALEICGRLDDQVKVRGMRVEPAEVAATLARHERVSDCVAVARRDPVGETALVAYYVAGPGDPPDPAALRAFLRQRLAGPGVPSAYVRLDSLPLLPNGKVDRKSLPPPEWTAIRTEYVEPVSREEKILAQIWQEVLGLPRVGLRDDFFDLGGHSLNATRVMARASEALGAEVPLRVLFESPTVEGLARAFDEGSRRGAGPAGLDAAPAERPQVEGAPTRDPAGTGTPDLRPARPAAADARRRLLALRLARARQGAAATSDSTGARASSTAPLSFAQEALWFLDQLTGASSLYNVAMSARLRGALDVDALERSLRALMERHETLRTSIDDGTGHPVQLVSPDAAPALRVEDLDAAPAALREVLLSGEIARQACVAFDLAKSPLIRAHLYRVDPEDHVLLIVVHHIVADGWSRAIIARDLGAFYSAFVRGEAPDLPALPLQFGDFARWQREQAEGGALGESLAYWKARLAGLDPIELPQDRPRPARPGFRGGVVDFALPADKLARLKALALGANATLYMTLLAAFKVLLMRYGAQPDVAVGTPTAGRLRSGTEGLVGFFVNTLVMRTDLSGDPRFDELLGRVRATTLGALAHQDLPFETLVRALAPDRELGRNPIYQVSFALQNMPQDALSIGTTPARLVPVHTDTAKFDLSLAMTELEDRIEAQFEHSADLFDRETIERMAGHFVNLIDGILADPSARLSALPLMRSDELQQVLVQWNDTARDYPLHKTLHQLVEEQADRTPGAPAVIFEQQSLDCDSLEREANRLAHHLRSLGVGPDTVVGLCMHRSLEMVVAMLGILKAGGAYLPIDPGYPPDRIAFVLEDSAAPVLLTQQALLEPLREAGAAARAIALDSDDWRQRRASLPDSRPEPLAGPENLAYVIYTSGSTGKPKGVMVPHRGICNRVLWMLERIGLSADDRVLQKTTISFDASVWEFFSPLAVGSPIVLARPGGEKDTDYLARAIRDHGITVMQTVPSALRTLLLEPAISSCTTLRYAVAVGEALDWELVREFERRLPGARLGNFYGPTEASDITTSIDVAELAPGAGPVPIGRPIPNSRVYVLDGALRPVPIGVPGELYIGGVGLARGYLGRPELTAERFLPDPFQPGQRMYRTGDLVRWRPDGIVGFIGRTDHQVKIRGFRVELGEIETALNGCRGVRQSVVVAREHTAGDRRLVAYVEGDRPDPVSLRSALRDVLPEYMLPAAIVPLAALPRLPNGKLDRKSLPVPWTEDAAAAPDFAAPRSRTEKALAAIWSEVLGHERVGIRDNFFDLGGHSLSAAQSMARLRSVLEVDLPLRALFESPTIAELAGRVQQALGLDAPQDGGLRLASGATHSGPTPLSSAQQGLWTIDRLTGPSGAYNITHATRLQGPLDADALRLALQAFVDRHPALRTRFDELDGVPVQAAEPAVSVPLPVEPLGVRPGFSAEAAIDDEVRRLSNEPFDLHAAPLFRARLLKLADEDHVFVFVVHHIVADGWSMGLLARELGRAYERARRGEPAATTARASDIGFADHVLWQRDRLAGDAARASLAWWKEQLGELEPIALPTDRPRPSTALQRGGSVRLALDADRLARLKSLARSARATLHMVLLAAFETLLMRYSGQREFAVGTPVAGRGRAEFDDVFGMFVNMLAMRADLSGDPAFIDLVGRVKHTALDAYSHQEIPFDRIVAELRPQRELNRNPLFQVAFVLQNTLSTELVLPGIVSRPVRAENEASKFDLGLSMVEVGGELRGSLNYSADLFDQATIERMAGHFVNLVEGIVANSNARLSALPLLSPQELQTALVDWNDTARDYPANATLHALFEKQAARAPEATAVVFERRACLDYGTLNRRANQLAHRLRRLGIGPDVLVGLCMQRGPRMVVAMLAILKAGAAYVPIDVDYPAERVAFMLGDSGAPVTLTERALEPRLAGTGSRLLCVDEDRTFEGEPEHDPEPLAQAHDLAYVIYTSGSTGKPKGVMVPHRAVARLVCNTDYVRISPSDCIAQASNASFDAATFEVWGALLNGARLAIVPTDTLLSPAALKRQIAEDGIRTMFVTTALFNEHAANAPDTFAELRDLLFGGEAVDPEAVARVLRATPPRRLVHVYGPTETTTFATWHEVSPALIRDGVPPTIPIGRPIANTTCHVLDAAMQPVPVGVTGDLWIGGPGLARGYLHRPDLDAERFVDGTGPTGERLYRTGDRVRRMADGAIVFGGRSDDQVKLRGFRIELGEVRAAIAALSGIAQQAVVVREDSPGDRRMVAYVVWQEGAERLATAGLRAALSERLPSFMIPAAFVALEALPLTPNGKLDRAALPPPSAEERPDERASEEGDEIESELRSIWTSVLGQRDIPLDADFFDLGGHSILAVRVLSEIDRRMGRQLRTAAFFEAPTIRSFAALMRRQAAVEGDSCVVTIKRGNGERPLFFVSGWGGQLIVFNELASRLAPDQPLHVLDTGAFDADQGALSIEGVAAKMIADMRRIQPSGPYRLAGFSMGGNIVHEIAQQLVRDGEQVALLALLDCSVPGYPRRRSAPVRVLLHLREAVRMKPARMISYVAGRARWMVRHMRPRERELFEGEVVTQTALTRAMERNARAMLAAWKAYRPRFYPGRITLIRAEATPRRIGQIRDDPTFSWGALTGGGVEIRSMDCVHNRMLFAPHAADLARILTEAIGRDDPGVHSVPAAGDYADADA